MPSRNPFDEPDTREPVEGLFFEQEVALANRNHGIALEMLRHDVTPVGMHYLLIHFDVPYVSEADAAAWRLEIGGRVSRPLSLSIAEIKSLPSRTLRVTLECAGNGRARYTPRWPSMPWLLGAVGTAEWTGTPLRHVLERAGLGKDVVDVSFHGIDRGFDKGNEHEYGRSLKPELAMSDDVMLVWAMNGQPLAPQHGFPLRLVVPGWYGMASVKWLNRIEALTSPYQGYQQVGTYHFRTRPGEQGTPITTMRVKSLMVPPGLPDWYSGKRLVQAGQATIHGRAWSGKATPIARVELSINGEWRDAVLDPPAGPYAWRGWRYDWNATPGGYDIACRATDAAGNVQPNEAPFDRGGFGNNGLHRIEVFVR
ncbi:MAG: sulfite oxidase [Hyphomicrobiaceae bacterium]|nr:sulfite oxidase [Hyphomicrobiaceae bacterium]